MVKDSVQFIRHWLYACELVMLSAAFFAVYYLGLNIHFFHEKLHFLPLIKLIREPWPIEVYLRAFWLTLAIWAVLLKVRDDYGSRHRRSYSGVFLMHFANGCLFFFFTTSAAFILKFDFLGRVFLACYTVVSVVLLFLVRSAVLAVAFFVRSRGHDHKNLLIVGTGNRARKFAELVSFHKEWGYRVVGFLDRYPNLVGDKVAGHEVIGTLESLPGILKEKVIDQVVFVIPRKWIERIEKCVRYCEAVGVPATLSADFFDLKTASLVPDELEGFTCVTFETRILKEEELLLKRVFDILISSVVLVVIAPALAVVAVAVKLSSKGPVFFRQVRCGRNGRRFTLYKFRSMVADAEARLAGLKELNEMSGPVFKMAHDPRVTRIGAFLRKTSLDEFPQLWNVLKGDMSLVGPRPPLPAEVTQYEPWHRRRLSMKPGITCLWQVSGRNEVDFKQWMELDLDYIDHWSLWTDIKIMLLTARALITRRGAE
ncbi:MAG: sugar transferase [Candidatus Omnitrophica bacterium]|nr:sugar transferase [Candidatus Omnitrophota bacterium]